VGGFTRRGGILGPIEAFRRGRSRAIGPRTGSPSGLAIVPASRSWTYSRRASFAASLATFGRLARRSAGLPTWRGNAQRPRVVGVSISLWRARLGATALRVLGKGPFESWTELDALAGRLGPRLGSMILFAAATGMRAPLSPQHPNLRAGPRGTCAMRSVPAPSAVGERTRVFPTPGTQAPRALRSGRRAASRSNELPSEPPTGLVGPLRAPVHRAGDHRNPRWLSQI
jgi:hypothetical protein